MNEEEALWLRNVYNTWRARQGKFCYPVVLAQQYGAGVASALYYVLNCCIRERNFRAFLRDDEIMAVTGASLVELEEMRERCKQYLKSELVNPKAGIFGYELDPKTLAQRLCQPESMSSNEILQL